MFHLLAKLAAIVLTPSNLLILLLFGGLILAARGKSRTFGKRLAFLAATALCAVAIMPVGGWLLVPLEGRFADYAPDGAPVAGVIVLGGGVSLGAARASVNEAADRLFLAAELAKVHPEARVVVAGGPIEADGRSEADAAVRFLVAFGIPRARIVAERRSRDTFENAAFSRRALNPRPSERWLLVTSAFHMPRAVAVFRKAGFNVVAAPADRRWSGNLTRQWSTSGNLRRLDLAVKEYIGLIAYRARGRTAEIFPVLHPALPPALEGP